MKLSTRAALIHRIHGMGKLKTLIKLRVKVFFTFTFLYYSTPSELPSSHCKKREKEENTSAFIEMENWKIHSLSSFLSILKIHFISKHYPLTPCSGKPLSLSLIKDLSSTVLTQFPVQFHDILSLLPQSVFTVARQINLN